MSVQELHFNFVDRSSAPPGPSVPPVCGQQRGRAAQRTRRLSDQQPRAAADRAAVRERPESAGARGERRPAVLFGLHTEHTGGAAHHQHAAGGEDDAGALRLGSVSIRDSHTHTHTLSRCTTM